MVINVNTQVVRWKYEGKEFAFCILTDYLKANKAIAYVCVKHAKDTIVVAPKKYLETKEERLDKI